MSRIIAFSRDPGGANTVIPLVSPLRERGHDVLLYGKDTALGKYCQEGLIGIDIMAVVPAITPNALRRFMEKEAPDAIVTGTSADDFTEKYIWKAGTELNIPSLAIMDQWNNYGLRFSNHGVNDIEEYDRNRFHPYLPTRIVAMDECARMEMVEEGIPQERIVVCGQPYFETVLKSGTDDFALAACRNRNHMSQDEFVVVFASEPITKTYGENAGEYWGYTETTILSTLIHSLETIAKETGRRIALVFRPHPKETMADFRNLAEPSVLRFIVDENTVPWALMKSADLVCGMSSMFLIEAVILGRQVMSVQIGLQRDDPFILARRGIMESIKTECELLARLRQAVNVGWRPQPRFDVIRNPVERIMKEMEALLCRNLR